VIGLLAFGLVLAIAGLLAAALVGTIHRVRRVARKAGKAT